MMHKIAVLTCMLVINITTWSQNFISFNHDDNRDFSMYWKPSVKVNEWDSISFTKSKFGYSEKFIYRGLMNNNRFHGYGELQGSNTIYRGTWKEGRPDGYGHLIKKHALLDRIEFKGNFIEGKPTEGLYFMVSRDKKPTVFYNGEVMYENGRILWHGYGHILRLQKGEWDKFGMEGGFYAGQFYRSAATGFGITNIMENGILTNLATSLVLADRVVKTFDILPLRTDILLETDYTPPATNSILHNLLPNYNQATRISILVDTIARYTGTAIRNEPYGLGMVQYKDGFVDVGFWRQGKKIPVKEMLAALLPDPSVLEPREQQEFIKFPDYIPKTKRDKARMEWRVEKKKVISYAPLNSAGLAEGWGWKLVPGEVSPVQGGKYTGKALQKKGTFNGDTLYIMVNEEMHKMGYPGLYSISGGYVDYTKRQNYYMETSERWMLLAFKQSISAGGHDTHTQFNYKPIYMHTGYADDREYRDLVVASQQAYVDGKKQEAAAFKQLPVLMLTEVVISRSNPAASYVSDGKQKVGVSSWNAFDIKVSDYVLSNNKFKRVSQLFGTYLLLEDNTSLNRDGSRYYGIRNYRLQYQSNDWVCPSCKGTGGTVSEKKVNIVSGYNNNINYGSQTATIVSTPVYTQIGGMNVKTPCDACKGVGIKKIELTRVQVLD
jgi:hypothetical protein